MLKSGTISFRYNYAINGRQGTLVLGRYRPDGIKLSEARKLLVEAKKTLAARRSPARQKAAAGRRPRTTSGSRPRSGSSAIRWPTRRAICAPRCTSATCSALRKAEAGRGDQLRRSTRVTS
ncbi:integrase arm-type DNA-binding domain-containing protein [Massilia norwichensis]|uniref:integrase arm-type DNA-binding domain-containing protein n=1 Tax=Massilia norwichensis TaxID=1442366 RepID=UPI00351D56FA